MSKKSEKPKKTRKPAAASVRKPAAIGDPIFALIAEHKALTKKMYRLSDKLDEAQAEATEIHGKRPFELIAWRSYSAIGGSEIDRAREKFLSQPGADREQIEKEYLDAKARLAAAESACVEWDHRVGVAPLREQYERANDAWRKTVMRMARTKPVTPAGAAALIDYARRDIDIGESVIGWPTVALKTAVRALTSMNAEAA
jgi:hypothetical protein